MICSTTLRGKSHNRSHSKDQDGPTVSLCDLHKVEEIVNERNCDPVVFALSHDTHCLFRRLEPATDATWISFCLIRDFI